MKVVILADCISTQNTGIHRFALQWVQCVIQKYPSHEYVIIASEQIPDVQARQVIIPIKNHIPFHLRWRQLVSIPKKVNAINPDWAIELAHFGPFRLNKGIKRATMIHDITPITYPQFHDYLSVMWHKLFFKSVIKRADWILTNSESTKKEIIEYTSKDGEKITVNYPKVAKTNNLNQNDQYSFKILTIGTIEPRKDQLTLIRAFERIQLIGTQQLELVIIGKNGWKNGAFWKYLEGLKPEIRKRIKVKGFLSRDVLNEELTEADLFVFPSIAEGFGLPILEAMSMEIPVLLSDIAIHKEVGGDAAAFFKCQDVNDLAQKIQTLGSHPKILVQMKAKSSKQFEFIQNMSFIVPFLNKMES